MREDIQSVLYSPETLAEKVRQMGQRISQDYAGKNPLLVSVLKGSVVFMSDLMRAIEEDRQPEANAYHARATLEIINGIYASQLAGRVVALPLKDRVHPLEKQETETHDS